MSAVASCGCSTDSIDELEEVIMESADRANRPAIRSGVYCKICAARLRANGGTFNDWHSAEKWLWDQYGEKNDRY